jgi:hypothetical protein
LYGSADPRARLARSSGGVPSLATGESMKNTKKSAKALVKIQTGIKAGLREQAEKAG